MQDFTVLFQCPVVMSPVDVSVQHTFFASCMLYGASKLNNYKNKPYDQPTNNQCSYNCYNMHTCSLQVLWAQKSAQHT